jgi:hypothetical protein
MPDVLNLASTWVADHPLWGVAAAIGLVVYIRMMRA